MTQAMVDTGVGDEDVAENIVDEEGLTEVEEEIEEHLYTITKRRYL